MILIVDAVEEWPMSVEAVVGLCTDHVVLATAPCMRDVIFGLQPYLQTFYNKSINTLFYTRWSAVA